MLLSLTLLKMTLNSKHRAKKKDKSQEPKIWKQKKPTTQKQNKTNFPQEKVVNADLKTRTE